MYITTNIWYSCKLTWTYIPTLVYDSHPIETNPFTCLIYEDTQSLLGIRLENIRRQNAFLIWNDFTKILSFHVLLWPCTHIRTKSLKSIFVFSITSLKPSLLKYKLQFSSPYYLFCENKLAISYHGLDFKVQCSDNYHHMVNCIGK